MAENGINYRLRSGTYLAYVRLQFGIVKSNNARILEPCEATDRYLFNVPQDRPPFLYGLRAFGVGETNKDLLYAIDFIEYRGKKCNLTGAQNPEIFDGETEACTKTRSSNEGNPRIPAGVSKTDMGGSLVLTREGQFVCLYGVINSPEVEVEHTGWSKHTRYAREFWYDKI